MTSVVYIRAQLTPEILDEYLAWHRDEMFPKAIEVMKPQFARKYTTNDNGFVVVYGFANSEAIEAVRPATEELTKMVDARWPDVKRTREVLELLDEYTAPAEAAAEQAAE